MGKGMKRRFNEHVDLLFRMVMESLANLDISESVYLDEYSKYVNQWICSSFAM